MDSLRAPEAAVCFAYMNWLLFTLAFFWLRRESEPDHSNAV